MEQSLVGFDGVDAFEIGGDGFEAQLFKAVGVHGGDVKIARFAARGSFGAWRGGGVFEQRVNQVRIALGQLDETAPPRFVGRNGVVLDPLAVGERIKIRRRADRSVHVRNRERRDAGFGAKGRQRLRLRARRRGQGNRPGAAGSPFRIVIKFNFHRKNRRTISNHGPSVHPLNVCGRNSTIANGAEG